MFSEMPTTYLNDILVDTGPLAVVHFVTIILFYPLTKFNVHVTIKGNYWQRLTD